MSSQAASRSDKYKTWDVRPLDSCAYALSVAGLVAVAGLLDGGEARIWYLIGAPVLAVALFLVVPPRRVWLADDQLLVRQRGRTRTLKLEEVKKVSLPFDLKKGKSLFLERSDGTGLMIGRLDSGTVEFRSNLGRELLRLNHGVAVSPEAAPFLGLKT